MDVRIFANQTLSDLQYWRNRESDSNGAIRVVRISPEPDGEYTIWVAADTSMQSLSR